MSATTDFRDPARRQAFAHKNPILWRPYGRPDGYTVVTRSGERIPSQAAVGDIVTSTAPNFGATPRLVVDYAPAQGAEQFFQIVKEPEMLSREVSNGFYGCHSGVVTHEPGPDREGLVFLPWHESVITSMVLPQTATFFVTGPLSGCNVYVAEGPGGNTQVCHANSNAMKTLERPDLAVAYMDKLYTLAARPGFRLVARLQKGDYLPSLQLSERTDPDGAGKVSTDITTALLDAYVARKQAATGDRGARGDVTLTSTQSFVFGERDLASSKWTFYYHVAGIASYTRSWRSNVKEKWKSIVDVAPVPAANERALVTGPLNAQNLVGRISETARRAVR